MSHERMNPNQFRQLNEAQQTPGSAFLELMLGTFAQETVAISNIYFGADYIYLA